MLLRRYFAAAVPDEDGDAKMEEDEETKEEEEASLQNLTFLQQVLSQFIKDVVLRIKQFSGELLYAAIEMLLFVLLLAPFLVSVF